MWCLLRGVRALDEPTAWDLVKAMAQSHPKHIYRLDMIGMFQPADAGISPGRPQAEHAAEHAQG